MTAIQQVEVDIEVIIDAQRGFADLSLNAANGGVLYVPGGEEIDAPIASTIANRKNAIIVLSQDFHPANHISFMTNHPGVMAYRIEKFKQFLTAHNQPIPQGEELYLAAQQPAHFFDGLDKAPALFPFEEIVLDIDGRILGLREGDQVRKVELDTAEPTNSNVGRITKVADKVFTKPLSQIFGARTQTL